MLCSLHSSWEWCTSCKIGFTPLRRSQTQQSSPDQSVHLSLSEATPTFSINVVFDKFSKGKWVGNDALCYYLNITCMDQSQCSLLLNLKLPSTSDLSSLVIGPSQTLIKQVGGVGRISFHLSEQKGNKGFCFVHAILR